MFCKGDRIIYVPTHAGGDTRHPDCEHGVVKRMNDDGSCAFVIYDNAMMRMVTGDEPYTAKSTRIEDLVEEE
jgi:hypothetical protein